MLTTLIVFWYVRATLAGPSNLAPIFAENIFARLWRTALTGPPSLGDTEGWPHYTQGAYNNTLQEDILPGTYVDTEASGWTSGFFADALWQACRRRTGLTHRETFLGEPSSEEWLAMAEAWTEPLVTNINLTDTHDLGFLAKPFESAMQIQGNDRYLPVLRNMSLNLAARFEPGAGIIRSWDCNLALLARSASTYTHNSTLLSIATSHADKTIQHHIRPDGSSFHVCDYSATTGEVYLCRTAQGLADNSTWARGQAWGIYGFAEFYSLTGDAKYLEASQRMADWFIEHLPDDRLPFWDFDAKYVPNVTPRDSSAATVAASGLILLQGQINQSKGRPGTRGHQRHRNNQKYLKAAENLLEASVKLALAGEINFAESVPLGAETYIDTPANTDVSRGFESILMHATSNNNPGANPKNFDSGLSYGDFYLVEAGNRLLEFEML
ncbi:hypothetical protein MBLNU13_g02550t1 [Cladosporium sp. NU13]